MHIVLPTYRPKVLLNFRRWSRKNYAVFASLGKLVRIATLKTVVSETLSRKDGAANPFDPCFYPCDDVERDDSPDDTSADMWLASNLLAVVAVVSKSEGAQAPSLRCYNSNPIGLRLWGFLLPFALVAAVDHHTVAFTVFGDKTALFPTLTAMCRHQTHLP
ncbi:MAG: hypothetical protein QM786_13730 [Breznakibacter sp.]